MYLYIFFEIIYLLIIIINFIINKSFDLFNIGPAVISIIYTFINRNNKPNLYLILSLIFSLCGDIFFIILDKTVLGVSSFMIVQMFYLFYLKGKSYKLLIIMLLNFFICIFISKNILIIECIFYAIIFFTNMVFCINSIKNRKVPVIFLLALFSLLICDTNVAIIKKINLSNAIKLTLSIIEWVFYTFNLIIITLLANGIFNKKCTIKRL